MMKIMKVEQKQTMGKFMMRKMESKNHNEKKKHL